MTAAVRMTRGEISARGVAARALDRSHHFEPFPMRVPDRSCGYFGDGRHERLSPQGRPTDLFGDVIVTVSRVRAMEART